MKLLFTNPRMERPVIRGPYDLLLGAVADLEVLVHQHLLYREEMMPIVELALSLRDWLSSNLPRREHFEFQSLEADEAGALWIRSSGSGWRIGSLYQEYVELTEWSDSEVTDALEAFIEQVDSWLKTTQGVGIDAAM